MRFVRVLFAALVIFLALARPLFAAPHEEPPIVLRVQGDASLDRVRDALSPNLRTLVAAGEGADSRARHLFVDIHGTTVTVTYRDEKGQDMTRTVQAANEDAVLETASILADNLVTDQTRTLLIPKEQKAARPWHPAVVSLVYPIASNWGKPNVRTPFALDALYGRIGELDGLQLSGLMGQIGGPVHGAQIAGLVATSGEDVSGLQMAGIASVAKGGVHGLQMAGITAIAPGGVQGLQLSPVSVAGDVQGLQVGVVNVAGKVKGMQFGVVNIADDVDGFSFGAFNYSRNGKMGAVAWSSNHGLANVGVKFATKYTYTVVRGTYARERGSDFMGPGVNLGVHLPVLAPFFLDVDLGTTWMFRTTESGATEFDDHQARLLAGAELFGHVSVFGGGGLDIQVERKDARDVRFGPVFSAGVQVMY